MNLQILRNVNYINDGTVYYDDQNVWLLRQRGSSNDMTLNGARIYGKSFDSIYVQGKILDNGNAEIEFTYKPLNNSSVMFIVKYKTADHSVFLTECD